VQMAQPEYSRDVTALLDRCRELDVGTMIIKAITRGPWGDHPETHTTWHRPFEDRDRIQRAVDFVLSYDVTGICTPGDTRLLPLVLEAAERCTPMPRPDREALIAEGGARYQPLFT